MYCSWSIRITLLGEDGNDGVQKHIATLDLLHSIPTHVLVFQTSSHEEDGKDLGAHRWDGMLRLGTACLCSRDTLFEKIKLATTANPLHADIIFNFFLMFSFRN